MERTVAYIALMLLLAFFLGSSVSIRYAKAWSGDITIRSDGSIGPPTAPVNQNGNKYSLTDNVQGSIVVEKNSIIVDGMGHAVQGTERSGIGIDLSLRTNVTIMNVQIETFDYGVYLASSNQNIIFQTNVTDNNDGIYVTDESSGNNISRNKVASNAFEGIALYYSSGNNIAGNVLTANSYDGVLLYSSSGNNILANVMTENRFDGVFLDSSSGNNMLQNNVTNNGGGVATRYSSGNRIVQNSFIGNFLQVSAEEATDSWDESYPTGGNYWSDYNGTDHYKGPSQNISGSDGIGDTPYAIDESNTDNYPLTKPYGGPRDIGILSVNTSRTIIGQGYVLNMTARILNYGEQTETLNVTTRANSTTLVQQVTLMTRELKTITFSWNTTGFAKGHYNVSASADPVPGETYTIDNAFIYGDVVVNTPGDINNDGYVNAKDAVHLGAAFNTRGGDTGYDVNADINGDGFVNAKDAVVLGSHFGEYL